MNCEVCGSVEANENALVVARIAQLFGASMVQAWLKDALDGCPVLEIRECRPCNYMGICINCPTCRLPTGARFKPQIRKFK